MSDCGQKLFRNIIFFKSYHFNLFCLSISLCGFFHIQNIFVHIFFKVIANQCFFPVNFYSIISKFGLNF